MSCLLASDDDAKPNCSAGSVGHPHSCAPPCKFWARPGGCCHGTACARCHLCAWKGRRFEYLGGSVVVGTEPEVSEAPQTIGRRKGAENRALSPELGHGDCLVCIAAGREYVKLAVTATPPELDDVLCNFAPGFDAGGDLDSLQQLREHLLSAGFTAASNSGELIQIVRQISEEDIETLRRSGMPLCMHSSSIVAAAVKQLRQILPSGLAVLGHYKARVRQLRVDHAGSIHKDDVLLTEDDVRLALFPPLSDSAADVNLVRYEQFCADARHAYPTLNLPCPCDVLESIVQSGDLRGLARQVIASIQRYNAEVSSPEKELVLDNVNVWIPIDSKQLVMLPLPLSEGIQYPLLRGDIEVLETRFRSEFKAVRAGVALVFFGQSILHQALIGPSFDTGGGSLEGRYLVLTTRAEAHGGALRNRVDDGPSDEVGFRTNASREAKKTWKAQACRRKPAGGGYGQFLLGNRAAIWAALPKGSQKSAIGKVALERWKAMKPEEREQYERCYRIELDKWQAEQASMGEGGCADRMSNDSEGD